MPTITDGTPVTTPGLITLAELKEYAGVADTSEDAYLAAVVAGVNAGVVRWLRRSFSPLTVVTEYLSGNGMASLYFKNRPLTALTGVWVDQGGFFGHGPEAFADSTELTLGVDFAYETLEQSERNRSRLENIRGYWPIGRGNIKGTYQYGYAAVPDDVKLGTLMIAGMIRSQRESGGPIESEDLGDYSYTLMTGSGSGKFVHDVATAIGLLKPYREVII